MVFYLRRVLRLNSTARIIRFALKRYSKQAFLIQPDQHLEVTFGEFEQRVERLIISLRQMGINKGDCVAYCNLNSDEYFELRAACHLCGIVFMGIACCMKKEDVDHFLRAAGAKAVFLNGQLQPLQGSASPIQGVATLNLSSGTTQKTPKIVKLTEQNWVESLYNYLRNTHIQPRHKIVFLCTLPLVTAGSTTFLPSLLAGISYVIIKETSSISNILFYIKKYNVNRLYITPSRLLELMDWCEQENEHLSPLEQIITGTEPFPASRLKEAIDFFGPIIYVGYGMVEALPPLSMLYPEDYGDQGNVGRVAQGVRVKIDADGKIAIKSKTVSPGYLGNPVESQQRFKNGWFYSNDYGFLDERGYLHILGRQEDIIATTPKRIFAEEVEALVYDLPFVKEAAVKGQDGRISVFIALREEIIKKEAERAVREKLKEILPDAQITVVIKNDLPINYMGKLDKKSL